jgi:ubiquinone/menaquinone biosynthesis C-methylase UbiE
MDVRDANILVHSKMAASYNEREPHFRPENRREVRTILEELRTQFGGRLLDIGCGTGFIIGLAADLFDDVEGVDITPAMLERVPKTANVHVQEADASKLPFAPSRFDLVTAYSFFHHLQDMRAVAAEACRVLRPGGGLYVDLEPNRHFWTAITSVQSTIDVSSSKLVRDEVDSVLHTDDRVAGEYAIPQDVFNLAEYNKAMTGGIDPDEFTSILRSVGFTQVTATYKWFAGQGKVLHGVSAEAAATVDRYLRDALPLSRGLYKYLQFNAVKPREPV